MRKRLTVLFFFTMVLFLSWIQPVKADATKGEFEDLPPKHISLKDIFTTPNGSNSQVFSSGSGDIVEITNSLNNQNGAIWSTQNNLMDLTQDFESSMYIYFGAENTNAADGMAFVMHNDLRGASESIVLGEGASIGVWEAPKYGSFGNAIKNSFAIEFDTHTNDDFDDPVKDSDHIAWSYPDQKGSYEDSGIIGFRKRKLYHRATQYPGELSTDNWFPFKIKWTAATSQLTYQFGDLEPVIVDMDTNVFNFTSEERKVYWGFTGSTGAKVEMNRVVFENVPGLVNADTKEEIFDKDGNSIANTPVWSGEELTYQITGSYHSGKQDWLNIVANLDIDENISYIPGTLEVIKTDGSIVQIPDSAWNEKHLEIPLGNLENPEDTDIVRFKTKVDTVVAPVDVTESASFEGQNYLAKGEDISYTIANPQLGIHLDKEGEIENIPVGEDYTIHGEWQSFNPASGLLSSTLDGKPLTNFKQENGLPGERNVFEETISAKDLKMGQNLVTYNVVSEGTSSTATSQSLILNVGQPPVLKLEEANTTIDLKVGEEYDFKGTWLDMDSEDVRILYKIGTKTYQLPNWRPNPIKGNSVSYDGTVYKEDLVVGPNTLTVYSLDREGLKSNEETITLNVGDKPELTLEDAGTTVSLPLGENYQFKGTWSDKDSSSVDLYYEIDTEGNGPIQIGGQIPNPIKGKLEPYDATVDNTFLQIGMNKLSVYSIDSDGLKSNVESLYLNVGGKLEFSKVPSTVTFEPSEIGAEKVKRANDWDIGVTDSRGTGSKWKLDVKLKNGFTNKESSNQLLAGELIYLNNANEETSIATDFVTVYSKETTNTNEVEVTWDADQGILLDIFDSAYKGTYTGTLEWLLTDGPG